MLSSHIKSGVLAGLGGEWSVSSGSLWLSQHPLWGVSAGLYYLFKSIHNFYVFIEFLFSTMM